MWSLLINNCNFVLELLVMLKEQEWSGNLYHVLLRCSPEINLSAKHTCKRKAFRMLSLPINLISGFIRTVF